MTLTDTDKMPFGKFKGTPMQDVPVSYLHWFWHNANAFTAEADAVKEYIKTSLDALRDENLDLIWKQ